MYPLKSATKFTTNSLFVSPQKPLRPPKSTKKSPPSHTPFDSINAESNDVQSVPSPSPSTPTMEQTMALLLDQVKQVNEKFDSVQTRLDRIEIDRDNELKNIKINHGSVKRESDDFMENMESKMDTMSDFYKTQQETIKMLKETNEDLKSTVTEQNIKLHASGKIPTDYSRYSTAHNPDAERYPLIKSLDPKHSFAKFQSHLSGIELESDSLASWENFWDTINSTLMMVLQSNQLFPNYRDLDMSFSPQSILIPPHGDPNHAAIVNAYSRFSRILRNFLLSSSTIKQEKAPDGYKFLLSERLETDGFNLLWLITSRSSPQLGGYARDLQAYVQELDMIDGEPVVDFYC